MSANLDTSKGFTALAFVGPRSAIWHSEGNSIDDKEKELGRKLSLDEMFTLGGADFTVLSVPLEYKNPVTGEMSVYTDRFAHVRNDTGRAVGQGSDHYKFVQCSDVQETLRQWCALDDALRLTTVGALNGGKRIWAQAEFQGTGDYSVAGDKHTKHVLLSTTFDTTSQTKGKFCATRVVCENTFSGAMGEVTPEISVRHSAKFDPEKARKELAQIAAGFDTYKAIGEAMSKDILGQQTLSVFLRGMLDIPLEYTEADFEDKVSTRKKNQRQAIIDAMMVTATERATTIGNLDSFTAFQGVTRWIDHERDSDNTENRLFLSGETLKQKAMDLLMPRIADKIAA